MENVIAKLLEDFEGGKMSRRQLIQSLAMAALAAPAASLAAQAPALADERRVWHAGAVETVVRPLRRRVGL
jgi:hypothetical protein